MRVEAECPHCGHIWSLDSSFMGTLRRCPECEEKFMFEEPAGGMPEPQQPASPALSAVAEQPSRTVGAIPNQAVDFGCPSCFTPFTLRGDAAMSSQVSCSYCGTGAARDDCLAMREKIDEAEQLVPILLLAGASHGDVQGALSQLEVSDAFSATMWGKHKLNLPFTRLAAISDDEVDVTVAPAACCDLCSRQLSAVEREKGHAVTWLKSSHSFNWLSVLALVVGRISYQVHEERMLGLYFVCDNCRSQLKPGFLSPQKYKGFPAEKGFKVEKFKSMQLEY